MPRIFTILIALLFVLAPSAADAAKDRIPVAVRVVDVSGNPVPTAIVRSSLEDERHRVNTVTAEWETSTLYAETGEEIPFKPGMSFEFEISAPGYQSQKIAITLQKRKNNFTVVLDRIVIPEEEDPNEVQIEFDRDLPIE